jgi:hypothetical protein
VRIRERKGQRTSRALAAAPALAAAMEPIIENLEPRRLMSTAAPAYLVPTAPGVQIQPLISTGDSVPLTGGAAGSTYRMAGIPDGLGAFDNGDGTFTVLMNHELRSTQGVARAHGNIGAFVSKWIIDKATGTVLSGQDQIQRVFLFDPTTGQYVNASPAFNRFCSATLGAPTAYYNPKTGLGTKERIFTDGEEFTEGRAMAHVVSSGESDELPGLGNLSFENVVPSPYPQDLTIVAADDDSNRAFTSEGAGTGTAEPPSEVYFYVGHKKATGSAIDRAGLTGGILNGLKVGSAPDETAIHSGDRFQLASLGDVSALDGPGLEAASIAAGVTQFRRPEDGAWDRTNPNVYYFVTTDIFGGDTRLWKLTFDDITHPELGGKIDIAIDSPASVPGEMFDNIDVNHNGDLVVLEDVGNNPYVGQVFQYDASSGDLFTIAKHDPRIFSDNDPATPGNQFALDADPYMPGVQGTVDEETSGVIDVSDILGPGHYLIDVQAHYTNSDPELVEGGQLLIINTNAAKATLTGGVLNVTGTVNDDRIEISRQGQTLSVAFNGATLGTFDSGAVQSIRVFGYAGDDQISVDRDVHAPALLDGGLGNDRISAGGANSILIGGGGRDALNGGDHEDALLGEGTTLDDAALGSALDIWAGAGNFDARVAQLKGIFSADKITDDGVQDLLTGGGGKDWIVA